MQQSLFGVVLPFGTDPTGRYLYRLAVEAFGLRPHAAGTSTTNHKVLPSCFLGLGDHVYPTGSPPHQQAHRNTDQSNVSTPSDDTSQNGWVFFQLGYLEALDSSKTPKPQLDKLPPHRDPTPHDIEEDWEETGFVVVARINSEGYTQGIYVVADLFPEIPGKDERKRVVGDNWGRPPHSDDKRFFCARVGRCLGDIWFLDSTGYVSDGGYQTQLVWAEKMEDEVELVLVEKAGQEA
ncbi:hypothetical protein CONLIGDRAFT_584671 [Coniochaeta ligniaria NRRL 30616]|uniref:Uncharacterized protein n=1 Tax=Coniochaeta ligniaria NRRL 30616 TaxID=1408157 RepID=A0A1J7IAJ4_9PEZI|nr:hypothetical protein CONLIGDRAFT_584671 [Coniochaeta ligniaria NRRL 30616]